LAVLAHSQVILLKLTRCDTVHVVVELVDQQHVRPDALHDLGNLPGLSVVAARQVADQLPLRGPIERGVVRGESHRRRLLGVARRQAPTDDQQHQQ
jgi:hypothetical protein